MRILFCGDVVGRSGRDILTGRLPGLREELALDLVIVNGENAAGGFGITADICKSLYQVGADVITLGNHAWDQRGTERYIETDGRLVRARNYPKGTPGSAGALLHTRDGRSVFVFQVLTQLFMDPIGEPFACVDETLQQHRLGQSVDALVLDVHGEATSEKQALAYLADGRASLVAGTHTHVPTADQRILPKGTAYISMSACAAATNRSSASPWTRRSPASPGSAPASARRRPRARPPSAPSWSRPTTRPGSRAMSACCGAAACSRRRGPSDADPCDGGQQSRRYSCTSQSVTAWW